MIHTFCYSLQLPPTSAFNKLLQERYSSSELVGAARAESRQPSACVMYGLRVR